MTTRAAALLLFSNLTALGFCQPALAQVPYGAASFTWEVSTDAGATWQSGVIVVPDTPRSVLVRALAEFPPEFRRYFGAVILDAVVLHAGPQDQITDWWNLMTGFNPWLPRRFGDTIKLDHRLDTLPPGQDPTLWLIASQGSPQTFPNPSYADPIAPFAYELSLDGTPGDRDIDAVFRPNETFQLARWIGTYRNVTPPDVQSYYSPIATYSPLTIRVVPGAGTSGIVLLGVTALGTRRRR